MLLYLFIGVHFLVGIAKGSKDCKENILICTFYSEKSHEIKIETDIY